MLKAAAVGGTTTVPGAGAELPLELQAPIRERLPIAAVRTVRRAWIRVFML